MTPIERFWLGVDRRGPDECWPYVGCPDVLWDGRPARKKRIAWLICKGAIPKGKLVLPNCTNPLCCNPAHSILGTRKTLGEIKVKAGRSTRGERSTSAVLNAEKVLRIRALRKTGLTYVAIGAQVGCSKGCARAACVDYWQHL
jgi:hypothetical protein